MRKGRLRDATALFFGNNFVFYKKSCTFAKIMADEQRKIDGYKSLKVYQKAVCVFDITAYFVAHFMDRGHDRTVDQMQQAARSGKQNIVEGYSDAEGSTESEHKLTVIPLKNKNLERLWF